MMISANKARKILSSHVVLKLVPELLSAVESVKSAERLWTNKANCQKCKESEVFADAEDQCIKAILGLSVDAARRFMKYLSVTELYVYQSVAGQSPVRKQLGV